jgi:phosphate uptake regulator
MFLATRLHNAAGYLERIAAHATNIAEIVIFRCAARTFATPATRRRPTRLTAGQDSGAADPPG